MCGLFTFTLVFTLSVIGIHGNLVLINAISELQTQITKRMDLLSERIDRIETRCDSNIKMEPDGSKSRSNKDHTHDNEVIKALHSQKVFIRNTLTSYEQGFDIFRQETIERYERKFENFQTELTNRYEHDYETFQKRIAEQVISLNATIEEAKIRNPCDLPHNAATYKTNKTRFDPGASISASDMSCAENQILSSKKSMTCREDGTWTNVIRCQGSHCGLPSNAAAYKTGKKRFSPGASISANDMSCPENQILSSNKSMICREDGTWTNIIGCNAKTRYLIRLQVHDSKNAGTSDKVYIQIIGQRESTTNLQLPGHFGPNLLVENEYIGRDLGSVQKVVVTKDGKDNMLVEYVSIYIEAREEYYVFRYPYQRTVWITHDKPFDFTLSDWPECCVHTYDDAVSRYPMFRCTDNICFLNITIRECKQRCATTRYTKCAGVFFKPTNDGKGLGECRHISKYRKHRYRTENTQGYMFYEKKCLK